MADPRFYENKGPFALGDLCGRIGLNFSDFAQSAFQIADIASLECAGPSELTFCAGKEGAKQLSDTKAGVVFIGKDAGNVAAPTNAIGVPCLSASQAIASALSLFYPESGLGAIAQNVAVHPTAVLGSNVILGHGAVVGPHAEIGDRTQIGANTVIGKGVAIGRGCEVGANVSIQCALIGDSVWILSGAQIGSPGFGFVSGRDGHMKIPQVGRVIIQDKVEIGACTTIDRGMLGDTIIGEGTKIDNLVQIGHNTKIGRHCIIVSQVGISGSCVLGDFVILGGQAGVADHATIGSGASFAARSGIPPGFTPGDVVYGGYPVRSRIQWAREVAAVKRLARGQGKKSDG